MEAKQILETIKNKSGFTENQTLEEYVAGLCKRFARVHGELLPHNDYEYIVKRLKETGEI